MKTTYTVKLTESERKQVLEALARWEKILEINYECKPTKKEQQAIYEKSQAVVSAWHKIKIATSSAT